jgi:hypothetical protein
MFYGMQDFFYLRPGISGETEELGFERKLKNGVCLLIRAKFKAFNTCGPRCWNGGNFREYVPHTECNQI